MPVKDCCGTWSDSNSEWATPKALFDQLNEEFHFTLDPCASDENHKCDLYFTKEHDGLAQSWAGHRVFCNPPYGRYTRKWIKKCWDESKHCPVIVMLLPARTNTTYFHDYIFNHSEIRWIRGKLHYNDGPEGAPFPSVIAIYRNMI